MANHISSSESQSFRLLCRVLKLGKERFGSNPSKGVVLESVIVGSSEVPSLPSALTMSSTESVASALRIIQLDRSLGFHVWELGLSEEVLEPFLAE